MKNVKLKMKKAEAERENRSVPGRPRGSVAGESAIPQWRDRGGWRSPRRWRARQAQTETITKPFNEIHRYSLMFTNIHRIGAFLEKIKSAGALPPSRTGCEPHGQSGGRQSLGNQGSSSYVKLCQTLEFIKCEPHWRTGV